MSYPVIHTLPGTEISNPTIFPQSKTRTHPVIRPEVIHLLIPHRDPHFLTDKLDSIERVREPLSVLDQPAPHEATQAHQSPGVILNREL